MDSQIRNIEVSVNHLMMLLQMHKRSIDNCPNEYSDSFIHGQQLILDDVLPQVDEIIENINILKDGVKNNESITTG